METTKKWYKSKTEITLLIGFAALMLTQILPGAGVPTQPAGEIVAEEADTLATVILSLVAGVSYLIAFGMRLIAKDKLVALLMIGVMLSGVCGLTGCFDPIYTAEHRQLIRTQAVIVTQLDKHCQAGDAEACQQGLSIAAETLQTLAAEN